MLLTESFDGEKKEFRFHIGWFLTVFFVFFAAILGTVSRAVFDTPWHVTVLSVILLFGIAILLMIEAVTVLGALPWFFSSEYTKRVETGFPVVRCVFSDDG